MKRFCLMLYSLLWLLLLPLVFARLAWRARKEPAYLSHPWERLALYGEEAGAHHGALWLHAVSLGETRAALPLLRALLDADPQQRILLSHTTATGRAAGAELLAGYGERVRQIWLPYDLGFLQRRLVHTFAPRLCILMETEVWPNLMQVARQEGLPVLLANARMSARSVRKAQRMRWLLQPAYAALSAVAAQTAQDAERLQSLGARQVSISGSIKFDIEIPAACLQTGAQLKRLIGARRVFLCASTREGEEALLLPAFAALQRQHPDWLLLLVPRHPQRFDEVAALAQQHGLRLQRRSALGDLAQAAALDPSCQLLLGDSMGEMFVYCSAADLVFTGGSLLPLGGQNPIEACALGKAVLFGPHTFNFEWVCEQAIAAGAAQRVADVTELMQSAQILLQDAAQCVQRGAAAQAFAQAHRGATARSLQILRNLQDHNKRA
ncbi:lipid IV(A) 3-deoxy-D-manno-octulosonic acid transferase [Massilia sp. W12]|uniref:lipid IV(A) 3-deoxy-D-manno-octulosonic acid transferase n=1 Tax=Massilia sp. W12 TaxID=3126507 RepID=UPI0030D48DCA